MKRVYLETLGCAKNRVDSEIMLAALDRRGYALSDDPAQAEVIIVNTCAFLSEATEEGISRLLELSDNKSSAACEKLVCAGCMSERYRESLLEEVPEIDGLLGSSNFQDIPLLLDDLYANKQGRAVRLLKKPHYAQFENQARLRTTPGFMAYVKVAEGCSNMCSFCNIPSLRGYFSSRDIGSLVTEVGDLVAQGVKEINLISQDTSSYGVDLKDGTDLEGLLRALDTVEGNHWIRLFYAYPNTFHDGVIGAMGESRHVLPYLDMPFQHVSDPVLKAMNRRITEKEIRDKLDSMKSAIPDLTLRTTFITGFPNESEADFNKLLDFVCEGWFDHVGVFPYSHEDNIVSTKLGDPIPNTEKRRRRNALLEAQQQVSLTHNQKRVGQVIPVLVEGYSEETELLLQGRAAFQGPEVDGLVYINEGTAEPGGIYPVEITDAHAYDLVGHIQEKE